MLCLGQGVNQNDDYRNLSQQRSNLRRELLLSPDVKSLHALREEVELANEICQLIFLLLLAVLI